MNLIIDISSRIPRLICLIIESFRIDNFLSLILLVKVQFILWFLLFIILLIILQHFTERDKVLESIYSVSVFLNVIALDVFFSFMMINVAEFDFIGCS